MRLKNAISGMFVLALGLCVGSAVAMVLMASGGIGKLHHVPAIMSLDRNWNITGIVTPEHDSNIPKADTNDMLFRNGRLGGKSASSVKPPLESRGKPNAVR